MIVFNFNTRNVSRVYAAAGVEIREFVFFRELRTVCMSNNEHSTELIDILGVIDFNFMAFMRIFCRTCGVLKAHDMEVAPKMPI